MVDAESSGPVNVLARSFERQINELGVAGLEKWLKDSFCGPKVMLVPGWFMHDQDLAFADVVLDVADQFSKTSREIIGSAVKAALPTYNLSRASFLGFYEMARLAEGAGVERCLIWFADQLRRILGDDGKVAKRPTDLIEVISLRDALDCALRVSRRRNGQLRPTLGAVNSIERPRYFDGVEKVRRWCGNLIRNHPELYDFIPCWGPAYFLALSGDGASDADTLMVRLKSSDFKEGTPFHELYEYRSRRRDNALFAFDIDAMIAETTYINLEAITLGASGRLPVFGSDRTLYALTQSPTIGDQYVTSPDQAKQELEHISN
jgi:hypothetical protein